MGIVGEELWDSKRIPARSIVTNTRDHDPGNFLDYEFKRRAIIGPASDSCDLNRPCMYRELKVAQRKRARYRDETDLLDWQNARDRSLVLLHDCFGDISSFYNKSILDRIGI